MCAHTHILIVREQRGIAGHARLCSSRRGAARTQTRAGAGGRACARDCRRLGCAACMTMVRVGWSQLPLSASSIIILLTALCTCARPPRTLHITGCSAPQVRRGTPNHRHNNTTSHVAKNSKHAPCRARRCSRALLDSCQQSAAAWRALPGRRRACFSGRSNIWHSWSSDSEWKYAPYASRYVRSPHSCQVRSAQG